ncbi:MAG: glycosyltransferase family 2 protein [Halorhabdus sp.]
MTTRSFLESVSVAVLTQEKRSDMLPELLDSLRAAIPDRRTISILLVGDNLEAVKNAVEPTWADIRYIESDGTAIGGRQAAVDACETDWILFLDDDCTVAPGIFAAYADTIAGAEISRIGAVYGRVEFRGETTDALLGVFSTGMMDSFLAVEVANEIEWAPTANALFFVAAIETARGFDQSNPVAVSGEDVDMGISLQQAGFSNLTAPGARAFHTTETWNSICANVRRFYVSGRSQAWLVDKYPERRKLSRRLVKTIAGVIVGSMTVVFGGVLLTSLFIFLITVRFLDRVGTKSPYTLRQSLLAQLYVLSNDAGYTVQHFKTSGRPIRRLIMRFQWFRTRPCVEEQKHRELRRFSSEDNGD